MDDFNRKPEPKPFTGKIDPNLNIWLDDVYKENGGGGYLSPLGNTLRGIKILGSGLQLASLADDVIGLAFVVRPLLNLSDSNVSRSPRFSKLYQADQTTLAGYVRGLLDRRMGAQISHPALDNLNPWISPLTNLLLKSDGFPDLELETKTTPPGIRQEVYQYINGILEFNGPLTLNQVYQNVKGGIIPYIFNMWTHYIPEVRLGDHGMEPYFTAQQQNFWDFDTRIYHLFLNPNMKNVEGIYMTGQSIPSTLPQGAYSGIDNQQPSRRGPGQDTFEMQFKSVIARADTYECIDSFNGAVTYFNPDMQDGRREKIYRKLNSTELLDHDFKAYTWINLSTMELEWWVPRGK